MAAHLTASRMAGANGARRWTASRGLRVAARPTASRMAGANGARRWTAPSPLEATRGTSDELAVLFLMAQTTDPSSWR
jgi:hypothetical protein